MDCLACVLLLIALYGLAAKAPLWIVTGERPLERPRDWPVGVQESDPSYAISRMNLACRRRPSGSSPSQRPT